MNFFSHLLPLFISMSIGTVPLALSPLLQNEHNQPPKILLPSESYKVHFFSLTQGHTIVPSYFNFEDQKKFVILMPGEEFLESQGNYTKTSLQFKARWEGTLVKHNKHYCYTLTISGISLLGSYIAGVVLLNESIQETRQDQEVTFLFIGTPEESAASKKDQKDWFPF